MLIASGVSTRSGASTTWRARTGSKRSRTPRGRRGCEVGVTIGRDDRAEGDRSLQARSGPGAAGSGGRVAVDLEAALGLVELRCVPGREPARSLGSFALIEPGALLELRAARSPCAAVWLHCGFAFDDHRLDLSVVPVVLALSLLFASLCTVHSVHTVLTGGSPTLEARVHRRPGDSGSAFTGSPNHYTTDVRRGHGAQPRETRRAARPARTGSTRQTA